MYPTAIILLIMIKAYLTALMIFCIVLPPRFQHIAFELIVKVFYDLFATRLYDKHLFYYAFDVCINYIGGVVDSDLACVD